MQNNNCSTDGERARYAQMQSIKCEPALFGKRSARAAGFSLGLDVDSEDGQDDGQDQEQEGECEGDMDADVEVDPDQGSSDDESANNSGAAACSAAAVSSAISISAAAASGSAGSGVATAKKTAPSNGKKTKGRVKIKMEFIDNKLRRYTTFSKRKTGIMKKAYELSTLTGTQVMLLVASETGHVYTFATRKLQPMITSDAGKVLIQTCLNSPDPPVGPSHQPDQRMSATGFEETELSYTIGDEDVLPTKGERTPPAYHEQSLAVSQQHHHHHHHHQQQQQQQHGTTVSVSGLVGVRVPSPTPSKGVSVHLPSGFTTLLSPGSVMIPPSGHGSSAAATTASTTTTTAASTTASGTVMYQTAQGVVYTTPNAATLPEGVIFNFGQISQEQGGNGGTQQQFITIPVSLTSTPQRHKH